MKLGLQLVAEVRLQQVLWIDAAAFTVSAMPSPSLYNLVHFLGHAPLFLNDITGRLGLLTRIRALR